MVASSLCMYSVEHYAQPEVFKNAFSGLWWAVSAMLTVGYGDICPITTLGRIMAIFISFLGVGAVAIPTGIISAGFVEQYTKDSNTSLPIETDSIGEIHISVGHEYEGLSLLDLYENYHIRTYLIIRDNLTIIPTPDFILKSNDTLFIQNSCPRT